MCHIIICFFLVLLVVSLEQSKYGGMVTSKQTLGSVQLTGVKTEATLMKFALSPYAGGRFDLELYCDEQYYDERNLKVRVYREDAWWKGARNAPTCRDKIKHATKTIPLRFMFHKPSNRWVTSATHILDSHDLDVKTYWYILLDDCSLEEYYHDNSVPKLTYDFTIWDDIRGAMDPKAKWTHLSADERGIYEQHRLAMFVSIILIVYILFSMALSIQTSGTLHIALVLLLVTCVFDAASNFAEVVHLKRYEQDGVGYYSMDAIASHCEAISDSTVAILLLFVGCGWTLPTDVLTIPNNNSSSWIESVVSGLREPIVAAANISQGNPAALLIVVTYVLNTILAQCSRLYDDDFDSYHSYEHLPGRIQMFLRCFLGLFFLVGVNSIRNGGKCPRSLRPFLKTFMLLGCIWFLLLPIVSYVISKTADNHSKHFLVTKFTLLLQQCSYVGLTWLFTSQFHKNSAYHEVSKVSQSDSNLGDSNTLSSLSSQSVERSKLSINSFINIGKTKVRMD